MRPKLKLDPTRMEQVVVLIDRPVGVSGLPSGGDDVIAQVERFPCATPITDEALTLAACQRDAVVVEPGRANRAQAS
jgi:hypothetical protein